MGKRWKAMVAAACSTGKWGQTRECAAPALSVTKSDARKFLMKHASMISTGLAFILAFILGAAAAAAADLVQIKVGERGLESLTYRGVEYCDPAGAGALGFTGAGAMPRAAKKEDDAGFVTAPVSAKVEGTTVTQAYPWGTLVVAYEAKGADLTVTATLRNTSGKGLEGWRANVCQLNDRIVFRGGGDPHDNSIHMQWCHYYELNAGLRKPYEHLTQQYPHVYWWVDFAAPFDKQNVKVMFADLTGTWDTGVNRIKTDQGDRWPVFVAAMAWEMAKPDQVQQNTVKVAIRFRDQDVALRPAVEQLYQQAQAVKGPEQAAAWRAFNAAFEKSMPSALEVCADGYEAWGRSNGREVTWTDRRPIGTYFGCRDGVTSAKNPNGWFKDPKGVDTTTPEGCQAFAKRLLAEIDSTIGILKQAGAQGVIWYDIEGQHYPQPLTYVGDPRVLDSKHPHYKAFAPELNTPVEYNGETMPVVDACFRKFKDAGFKTGLTIRPQVITYVGAIPDGQSYENGGKETLPKARYAHDRWGCTLFYVDSISGVFGYWSMDEAAHALPDCLFLPEWATARSFRCSNQQSVTGLTGYRQGVPLEIQAAWPDAFVAMVHLNFAEMARNEAARADLVTAVKRGNLPGFDCFYNNTDAITVIKDVYAKTGVRHVPLAKDQKVSTAPDQPVAITLRATDEDGDALTFAILGPPAHGILSAFDAKKGTVTYTPSQGWKGTDSLTLKAVDSTGLNSNRGRVTVEVK